MSSLDFGIPVANKQYCLRPWRWQFWYDRKWQESAAVSSTFWLLNTYLIFQLVEQLGHGVLVAILVSLGWDVLTYSVNKLWIWRNTGISVKLSYSRNFAVWAGFFAINAGLYWVLSEQADMGIHHTRYTLGALGVLVNPVRFKINNRIFETPKTDEV